MNVLGSAPPPVELSAASSRLQRMHALTAVAARAMQADGACVVIDTMEGRGIEIARAGSAMSFANLGSLERASLRESLVIIDDLHRSPETNALETSGFRMYASVAFAIDETACGFVCAYAEGARAVTGAQEYVLRTLAAEIGEDLATGSLDMVSKIERDEIERQRVRLRLLESVVVNANDAVLITEAEPIDEPGPRILYANDAFTRTTGYELADIIGKTPRILHGKDTDPATRARLRNALERWEPIEVELLNYRRDGTRFWVELSIVPVADETGFFTHWVSVQRDVTERKAAEEFATRTRVTEAENTALAFKASHDDLTGLFNRAAFLERVALALAERRPDGVVRDAVIFLDLDRFKIVNDSLGHRVGDLLLVEVARRLRATLRPSDMLARMGGDEFTCLLTDLRGAEEAIEIADRVLVVLRESFFVAGQSVMANASIGLSIIDDRYSLPEDVLRDADTAMYRAKHEGGSRRAIFDESMHARAVAALRAQMDLSGALANGELVVYYQPLIDLTCGRVEGFEALVRWQHPKRGLVPPVDFIPVAEDTGIIVEMGAWILAQACTDARAWNAARLPGDEMMVSVNVSSRQLDDTRFFKRLCEALAGSGLAPHLLQLEITESVFLEHAEIVGALLVRIRELGVKVALDDFGTGYSSLSYLEKFPLDTLKIDRSFVDRVVTSKTTEEIVRLIVGIATALRMKVTAEGIETEAQATIVARCGCQSGQGYLYGRPVPLVETAEMLQPA